MKTIVIIVASLIALVVVGFFIAQIPVKKEVVNSKKHVVFDQSIYIAGVNEVGISRDEYQKKVARTKTFFAAKSQEIPNDTSIEKDVLEGMIVDALVEDYLTKKKVTVKDSEVADRYTKVIEGYGRRNKITSASEAAFLAEIKRLYGMDKTEYMQQLKKDIMKERAPQVAGKKFDVWLQDQRKSADIQLF